VRLEQVVSNLLGNAVKFGRGCPITVTAWGEPGRAVFEVRDRGIGVDPADAERIFDRFARAVSPAHYGGFGLGLYVSRQIVEAHGGRIGLVSGDGPGSTFRVTLPLAPPAGSPSARA
jgi:signal transduction histidine kinase